jgi:MYXO-CTERM domain-containing protein
VTVANTGDANLQIVSVSVTGPFSVTPSGPFTLAPGTSQGLSVKFSPTALGAFTGVLTLSSNDEANPNVSVTLTGQGVASAADVSPSSISFGEQGVGTASAPRTVMIRNVGDASFQISPVVTGPLAGSFSVTPSSSTVFVNEAAAFSVTFTPTAGGNATATLGFTTNEAGSPSVPSVALTGSGVKPAIAVSPSSLDFGELSVGTNGTRTVTVANTGTGTLIVTNATLSGSGGAAYSVTPTTLSIQAGESKALTVTFAPTAEGGSTATLSLSSNDVDRAIVNVAIAGTGVKPAVAVSPASLAFGEQRIGTSSSPRTVAVANTGTGTLIVNNIALSGTGAASYSFTPSSFSISAGQSKALTVVFAPAAAGPASASLILNTNDVANPAVVVALSGTGVSPTLSVNPTTLAFGNVPVGTNATLTLTVSNTGVGTLSISNISKSGPGAAAYSFTPSTLDVLEGQSKVVTLVFSPAAEGPTTATLNLTTNDAANPIVAISLSGTGARATASLSTSTLAFGSVRTGTSQQKTVTITNTGTSPLIISSAPSVMAPFGYVGPSTLTLNPNSSFDFQVSFAPTDEINYSGTLVFTSNASNSPTVLTLTGSGTLAQLSITPTSISFGDVLMGTPSAPRVLKLTNRGTSPLTLTALTLSGADTAAFILSAPTLPAVLQPASTVDVAVTFRPDAERQFSALLRVESSDSSASSVAVPLTGAGIHQPIHVSESTLEFGQQLILSTSSPRKVRIINGSSAPATVSALVVEGAGAAQFTVEKPALPFVLAAGQEQEVAVVFAPQAQAEVSGTLKVVFSSPALQLQVALHGRGISSSALSFTPSALDFGSLEVSEPSEPKVVTVTNPSSQEQQVVVKLRDTEGTPFAVELASLANPLPPGGSTTFKVTFQPTAVGDAQNEVQVWLQGATEASGRIPVTGTGTEAQQGCSCGSTKAGSSGMLAVLALLALASRRWRGARG